MLTIILISIACSTTGIAVWKTIEAKQYRKIVSIRSSVSQTCICGHTVNEHMNHSGGPCGRVMCSCYNFTALTKILRSPIRIETKPSFNQQITVIQKIITKLTSI